MIPPNAPFGKGHIGWTENPPSGLVLSRAREAFPSPTSFPLGRGVRSLAVASLLWVASRVVDRQRDLPGQELLQLLFRVGFDLGVQALPVGVHGHHAGEVLDADLPERLGLA